LAMMGLTAELMMAAFVLMEMRRGLSGGEA
jgi:hypothetical protein